MTKIQCPSKAPPPPPLVSERIFASIPTLPHAIPLSNIGNLEKLSPLTVGTFFELCDPQLHKMGEMIAMVEYPSGHAPNLLGTPSHLPELGDTVVLREGFMFVGITKRNGRED